MRVARTRVWIARLFALLLGVSGGCVALAHEGHDHGEAEPVGVSGSSWPRAAARSDAVEAVLVIAGAAAVLYLDAAANNEPIRGARVSLSGEGVSEMAWVESAPAVYTAELSLPPGRHALTVVVEAGEVFDLLPLTLEVPVLPPAELIEARPFPRWLAVALPLALLCGGILLWRRRRGGRLTVVALGLLLSAGAGAHGDEGHDHDHAHDDEAAAALPAARHALPAASGLLETPRRLGEAQVYVPKSVQRLWGLRTQALRREPLAAEMEWPGQVIADPESAGRLEAPEAGQAAPGPEGWPRIGQRVRAGEVLLRWQPRRGGLDAGRLAAEQQRLRGELAQAEARRERLRALSGFVAGRELGEADAALAALRAELAALDRGLAALPLRAPLSGVIVAQAVGAGVSLEAGAMLLQIADPQRLIVEALAPDASLGGLAPAATALLSAPAGGSFMLTLIDGGGAYRGTRVPWRFALVDPPVGLLVGQPLRVRVSAASTREGLTLPRTALLAGEEAAPVAWVHLAPEVFEQRRLDVAPLDAVRVELRRGAAAGERVVIHAAVLIGQVR
ncbi:MAG: HlyD family efflux transporter periplasmic adaptor subunit [Xanthomonadales bacterium]|nr:HlyD family efflux transporter periplasmic adaptor subunit [Xanthomonadales bacterium]